MILDVDGVVLHDYDMERDRRSAIWLGQISCFILTANELIIDNVDGVVLYDYGMERDREV